MSLHQLKVLLQSAQLLGLLPLSVGFQPYHAKPSRQAVMYSLIIACVLVLITITSLVGFVWVNLIIQAKHTTLMFTLTLASLIGALRTCSIYVVQLRKRHEIIALFNDAIRIRIMFMISYGSIFTDKPFLDRKCRKLVRWKIVSLVLQLVFVAVSMYLYDMAETDSLLFQIVVKLLLFVGTDVLLLMYTTMHFAAALVALQFFRDVNARLTESVSVVRELLLCRRQADANVRFHCNITDDIDRLAVLYDMVSDFANQAIDIFAVPLVLTLVNSFIYILISVCMGGLLAGILF